MWIIDRDPVLDQLRRTKWNCLGRILITLPINDYDDGGGPYKTTGKGATTVGKEITRKNMDSRILVAYSWRLGTRQS